jgi:pimeloyl-ACP methyl ester carboxylesterase
MYEAPDYPGAVPAERQYDFDSAGQRLRLYEWGDPDGFPVVLCHGYWDNAHGFDLLAPLLAQRYRVIALDTRGHGESAWVDQYHWSHMVYDVVHVLEFAASRHASAHLVGHSFGGSLATSAACIAPQLIDKLIDIEGFGPGTAEYPLPGNMGMFEPGSLAALRGYLEQRRKPHVFVSFRPYAQLDELVARRKLANPRLSDAWLRYFCWHGSRRNEAGWRWKADPELGAGADPFKVEWLGRSTQYLKRPMLAVIAAEQDSWGPLAPELLNQRLSYIPELERAKVPGTGHFPHMEKPGATAHLLLDYLQA